jgi:uracil-DNA glycosylase
LEYQREKFGSSDGGEAALELSSYEARNLEVKTPRERYLDARIKRLRELMSEYRPEIVVCYGRSRRCYFEALCGGPFDDGGFRWLEGTLCALTVHPTPRFRAANPAQYWIDLGVEMRQRRQCASYAER